MLKKFTKYIVQNVFAMIGISIYILADTFFISLHSGANGLAVLNLILPLFGLIFAIGSMTGIGSAIQFSIKKARCENTSYFFTQSVSWCMILSIPFIMLGILSPEKVLVIMGANNELLLLGTNYVRIILFATPLFMTNFTFTSFLRNDNAPKIAMFASIAASLFNVVFDYILMFPLNLGLTGAALATAISPIVTMLLCSIHFLKANNNITFKWKLPSIKGYITTCQFGVPAFVGEITAAITTITFNTLILSLVGNIGIAAYGVIANIALVVMSIFNGIAQGSQPLVSENYGHGNQKQLKQLLKWGITISLSVMAIVLAIIWGLTDTLIGVFNSDDNIELYQYAFVGMRLYFLGFIVACVNIYLVSYFAAIDKGMIALIGSISRGAIAIISCAIVLSKVFGMTGIWLSFLTSETITFVLILILYKKQKNQF
ncbi:MAG: MATE family efflux transporter [Lachnospiraceae bacterium]